MKSTELTVAELCDSGTTYHEENVTITDGTVSLLPRGYSAPLGSAIFTLTDGQNVARVTVANQPDSEPQPNRIAKLSNAYSQEDLLITANDGSHLVFGDSARVTGQAQMMYLDGTSRCGIFIGKSEEHVKSHIIEPLPRSADADVRAGGGTNPDGWNQRPEPIQTPDPSDFFEVPDDLPSPEDGDIVVVE